MLVLTFRTIVGMLKAAELFDIYRISYRTDPHVPYDMGIMVDGYKREDDICTMLIENGIIFKQKERTTTK